MNVKTIPAEIDDTKKLQAIIDSVGNTPTLFDFKTKAIKVNSLVRLYNGATLRGNGCVMTLMNDADPLVFKSMVPIIGAKLSSGGSDFDIFGLIFKGNDKNQSITPDRNGNINVSYKKKWGFGFHNFIGFQNASNISIHGICVEDSLGDGARLANVKNVRWYGNTVIRCGHDAFYVDGGENIEAWDNYTELRVNSSLRLRHVTNGYAHDNYAIALKGEIAYCPGMQIEVSTAGYSSKNIRIENNVIEGTLGPGIWIVGLKNTSVNAASGLTIKNNLFYDCGNMDGESHNLPGVGGIMCDGWNDVLITNNTFNKCKGYGVGFGVYIAATPSGTGYTAEVSNNIFANTGKAGTVGTASGSPVAKLVDRYKSVIMKNNCLYNNVSAPYRVTESGTINANPLLDEDNFVQEGSPCGSTIGRVEYPEDSVLMKCTEEDAKAISDYIPNIFKIFKKV